MDQLIFIRTIPWQIHVPCTISPYEYNQSRTQGFTSIKRARTWVKHVSMLPSLQDAQLRTPTTRSAGFGTDRRQAKNYEMWRETLRAVLSDTIHFEQQCALQTILQLNMHGMSLIIKILVEISPRTSLHNLTSLANLCTQKAYSTQTRHTKSSNFSN